MEERTAPEPVQAPQDAGAIPRPTWRERLRWLAAIWGLAAAWLILDQLTKHWALHVLPAGQREVIPGLLWFTLARNPGAAFSLFPGGRPLFVILAIFLAGVGVWAPLALDDSRRPCISTVGFGLLVGGALGNLADRLFREGLVVDFIDVGFWPIFNVADTGICIGSGLVLLYLIWNLFRPEVKRV